MKQWVEWSPRWSRQPGTEAKTVLARYESFDPLDAKPSQHVEARCVICGEEFRTLCESGNPTAHISKFALEHQNRHFDVIATRR